MDNTPSMAQLFEKLPSKLEHLNLNECRNINPLSFSKIPSPSSITVPATTTTTTATTLSRLTSLHLAYCGPTSFAFCWVSTLVEVDLEGVSTLLDSTLQSIVAASPNIRILKLKECHTLSDQVFHSLNNLQYLEELDLTKCLSLRNPSIAIPSLQYLYLSYTSIVQLNIRCPLLNTIDISGCPSLDESRSLEQVFSQSGRRILNFWAKNNSAITATTLALLAKYCKRLEIVNFSYCSNVEPVGVHTLVRIVLLHFV